MSVPTVRTALRRAALTVLLVAAPPGFASNFDVFQDSLDSVHTGHDCGTHRFELAAERAGSRALAPRQELVRLAPRAELQEWVAADGTRYLYRADRLAPETADRPQAVETAAAAIADGRRALRERLGLETPAGLEVRVVDLGPQAGGFAARLPHRHVIVVNSGGDVRRDAMHQLAHVAIHDLDARAVPTAWAETFASWLPIRIDGPDARDVRSMSARLARADAGLFSERPGLAVGSAIWLAYLDEAHGAAAVRFAIDGLASGLPAPQAFDLALRRSGTSDLDAALRDFQLWTVFVGERADGMHLSFAEMLDAPSFASSTDGLPTLAALSDPALDPWGSAIISLRPDAERGGVRLVLDGEPGTDGASWQADLLLLADGSAPRRLALAMNADGRGEVTVPAQGLSEILLLVRHGDDDASLRYTYAAHLDRAFPFELTGFDAVAGDGAVQLSWDTASERGLAGYNVVRSPDRGAGETVINPIRVPGLGDPQSETSYGYLDQSVEPGAVYVYRLQGITRQGLTTVSEPIVVRVPLD